MKYQHFLITQFNLKNFWSTDEQEHTRWLDWTKNRIKLFQNYCLPSVLNQNNQNFTWMIFVDQATPQPLIDQLTTTGISSPQIQWHYMDGYSAFKETYVNCIKKAINPSTKWIITTNLDNDDAIHENAIQSIQQNFAPIHDHLISLANGYCFDMQSKTLSHYYYPRSPFLSLIESTSADIKAIHYTGHTEWKNLKLNFFEELIMRMKHQKNKNVTYLLHSPLWIQVVHEQNVSNSFYRGIPVRKQINLEHFGISQVNNKLNLGAIFKYKNYYLWKRYIFCSLLSLIHSTYD